MHPLVTISINCEKFLIRCLESIRNQTYSNIEVTPINARASDNSIKITENRLNRYFLDPKFT